MTLWSLVSVYSDYQWRRVEHWSLGRRAMIGRVIQTMRTPRYKARPLICFITLQLLLCQVARALQLALCHLASPRQYLLNTQQLCRRSKSAKQRHCLLRSPAEWFSRYSSSTLHLPKLLPPLRMRCVRTSYARVHDMLGRVQLFFSCGVHDSDCPSSSDRMRGMVNI